MKKISHSFYVFRKIYMDFRFFARKIPGGKFWEKRSKKLLTQNVLPGDQYEEWVIVAKLGSTVLDGKIEASQAVYA